MWGPNFCLQIMLGQRRLDAGNEVAAIGFIVGMLQLAAPAFGKMATGRLLVVGSKGKRAVVENGIARYSERNVAAARSHAVAACGDPDDKLVHRRSSACGIAAARSSAIIWGPASSAARP